MASTEAIAKMRERAEQQLAVSMHTIASIVGVDAPILTEFNRDKDYLHATRLQEMADFMQSVGSALIARRGKAVSPTAQTLGPFDMKAITGSDVYLSIPDEDLRSRAQAAGIADADTLSREDLFTALDEKLPPWLRPNPNVNAGGEITGTEQTPPSVYSLLDDDELRLLADRRGIAETDPAMDRDTLIRNLEAFNKESAPDGTKTANAQTSKDETADLPATPANLEELKVQELKELAQTSYGVDISGLKTKAELIDAIEAAQGKTEAQQAAADGETFEEGDSDDTSKRTG